MFFFFMKKTEIPIFRQMYILILNKLIFTESKWLLIKQDMRDVNCPHIFWMFLERFCNHDDLFLWTMCTVRDNPGRYILSDRLYIN